MVENLRKAEFEAAQPVRNKETGKIDYIVRAADHKTAESAHFCKNGRNVWKSPK
jgi:hypothetical protein